MFERTKTIWRHLLGQPDVAGGVALQDGNEDRRSWARFSANLATTFKPAGAPDNTRQTARIRNISLGGINLLANAPMQPGEMLTIELPGATESTRCHVLACVVHCAEETGGEWSLGCTFARELSDVDLATFGAKRERLSPADKRQWKRFPCDITASFQFVAANDQAAYAAKVWNISPTGVGLLVDRAVDNGALLSVELHNGAGTTQRTMLTCVVHVNPQSDGAWALGCNFIRPLSEEDLKALL